MPILTAVSGAAAWFTLFLAGAVEIAMALLLKASRGWTRPVPSALAIAAALSSIFLLARAVQTLHAGTAYAVWTGIGTLGVAIFGIVVLEEPLSAARLGCMLLTLAGMIGLRLTAGH